MTFQESSLSLVKSKALFDELTKISEQTIGEQHRRELAKRWLTNTAIMALGAGTGAAIATGIDRVAPKIVAGALQNLSHEEKLVILGAASMGGAWAAKHLVNKLHEEHLRRMNLPFEYKNG